MNCNQQQGFEEKTQCTDGEGSRFSELFTTAWTQNEGHNPNVQTPIQKRRRRPRKLLHASALVNNGSQQPVEDEGLEEARRSWDIGQAVGMSSTNPDLVIQSLRE